MAGQMPRIRQSYRLRELLRRHRRRSTYLAGRRALGSLDAERRANYRYASKKFPGMQAPTVHEKFERICELLDRHVRVSVVGKELLIVEGE